MNKKIIHFFTLLCIFSALVSLSACKNSEEKMVLFVGDGCPNCEILKKFIEENHVKEKIQFEEKEIYKNRANAEELRNIAAKCGIAREKIGVPFFVNGSQCIIGYKDIQDFLEQEMGKNE